jgi:type I restriction enzyme M protein
MHRPPTEGGDGSKIAIVFNGSPCFTGDAGSGESNIRRWIIENDWLDAIVGLPDQMFYNTGIYTYIWLVSNKKPAHRRGKVQLIDGTSHFQKMKKSLGDKRNELSDEHIGELVRLYGDYKHDAQTITLSSDAVDSKHSVCSKILDNQDFGYIKITVERPLRLNFQVSPERIERLWEQPGFISLAVSKKRKDEAAYKAEVAAKELQQKAIIEALNQFDDTVYISRPSFEAALEKVLNSAGIRIAAPIKKAIIT